MTVRHELRALGRLAAPIALANLGGQLLAFVDMVMLGRYHSAALAGAGIASTVILMVQVVGMGAVLGLDTLVPQALGAGEAGRARRLLWAGIRVAVTVGVPLTAIAGATVAIYPRFGVAPAVATDARLYTLWRLPALLPMLIVTAQRAYLQAAGTTRPILVAIAAANALNVPLNAALIFGLPEVGLPPLGVAGAALATDVVSIAMAGILALAIRGVAAPPSREPIAPLARKTLRVGLPVGLQYGAEVGAFALVGVLAGAIGERAAAGHQVALTLASVAFNAALGLGSAAAVRVGQAVGRGDPAGTRRAGATALAAALGVMSISAVCLVAVPHALARWVTDDVAVAATAVPLIRIAALFQLSDGAQAVGAGVLRGCGDTRAAFAGNVAGHYAVGIPLAIALAFGAGWGAVGLWCGLSAGLTAVALALWVRFFSRAKTPIARA